MRRREQKHGAAGVGMSESGLARLDGIPLHRQLFLLLRGAIQSGRYTVASGFPTEETIMREFKVSRTTVRRALSSLEGEGMIERRQGAATRVAADITSYAMETSLSAHRRVVKDVAARTAIRSMTIDHPMPPPIVCIALGLAPDTAVTRVRRIRTIGDLPVWYTTAYFVPGLALPPDDGISVSVNLLDLLDKAGIDVGEMDETIGAVLAEPEAAAQLGVEIGAPLIETLTSVIDGNGNPVSFQITLVPPERRRIRVARRSNLIAEDDGR